MSSSSSRLLALALALALWPAFVLAQQQYVGTWTARHPNGGTVTLTLAPQGQGELAGKLEGNGASFDVEVEVLSDRIVGTVSGADAMVYLSGHVSGASMLVVLVEPGPGGAPDMQTARQINFTRGALSKPAGKKQG